MSSTERNIPQKDTPSSPVPATDQAHRQLELDVPSLATALQAAPHERLDRHLGRGVGFNLGDDEGAHLELYSQVVRVTVPKGQLVVPRTEAEVSPEGVVFQEHERFLLSVGPTGEVLFQYSPPSPASEADRDTPWDAQPGRAVPLPEPAPLPSSEPRDPPSPAPERKEKAKSEKYVGRLGEVKTHTTKTGKLVAEIELTVPDPDRPGASRLVKFAAFGEMAAALQRNYQPGQEVTAVGIPHELKRKTRDGREWTERQLYFVQPPKPR